MKILSVRFKNLNSLVGQWSIDFTVPHFTANGIFAIVGTTGSGKTTLLDAICLALYGRTPRLKQVSKTQNHIMNRQTGECFAEVEIQTAKGHFRSHWSQRRARKASTGELQPPRHEFADLDKGEIVTTKIKEVAKAVIAATGMNFEQFTRSVMLAQGEFSTFLKASVNERSPILEQITGTEIYSQISQQVHLRTTDEKKKYESLMQQLDSYELLTEEELSELTQHQQSLLLKTATVQKEVNSSTAILNWYQTIDTLKKEYQLLETVGQEILKEENKFQPKWESLVLTEKCLPITDLQQQLHEAKSLLSEESVQLIETKKEQNQISDKIEKISELQEKQRFNLGKQKLNLEQMREVYKKVVKLDFEAKQHLNQLEQHREAIHKLDHDLKECLTERSKIENRHRESVNKIDKLVAYKNANKVDQNLIEEYASIKESFEGLEIYREKLSHAEAIIKELHTGITEQKKQEKALSKSLTISENTLEAIRQKKEALLASIKTVTPEPLSFLYKNIQTEKETLHRLEKLKTLLLALTELETQLDTQNKQKTSFETKLEELEKNLVAKTHLQEVQQQNVEQQEELQLLSQKIQSYEEERKALREGSPCPLCGSPDHPYLESDPPSKTEISLQSELTEQKAILTKIFKEKQNLEISISSTKLKLKNCEEQHYEATSKILSIKEQIGACAKPIPKVNQHPRIEEINELIEIREKSTQNLDAKLIKLEQFEQERLELESTLNQALETNQNARDKNQEIQQQLTAHLTQYEQAEIGIKATKNEYETANLKVFSKVSIFFDKTDTQEEPADILENLKIRLDRWKSNDALLSDLKEQQQNSEKDLLQVSTTQTNLKTQLDKYKREHNKLQPIYLKIKNKREFLLGNRDPESDEKKLIEELSATESSIQTNTKLLSELAVAAATIKEREDNLQKSKRSRQADISRQEKEFRDAIAQLGFSSEQEFQNALLPLEIRKSIKHQHEELQKQLTENRIAIETTKKRLKTEREKNLSSKTAATIEMELEKQVEHLENLQQEKGALQNRIETHNQKQERFQEVQKNLKHQNIEYQHWQQLNILIGSADGKKFRNFAQGLTFEQMILFANKTLIKMSDRYLLTRSEIHPLELNVIDRYQAGEIRSTANLSGGESFIISLSLALALSSMSSNKVQVDSLFLDEGFGTLDEDALEIALDTLGSLQQENKIIGIISHVPMLKERIAVQLQLEAGLDGRSILSGPGVKRS